MISSNVFGMVVPSSSLEDVPSTSLGDVPDSQQVWKIFTFKIYVFKLYIPPQKVPLKNEIYLYLDLF